LTLHNLQREVFMLSDGSKDAVFHSFENLEILGELEKHRAP
jgi:hypothetical protein